MSIASIIVMALALGVVDMLLFRRCGEAVPVRLSAGLLIVLSVSVVHAILYWLGFLAGGLLALGSPTDPHMYADVNAYIFLGLVIVVVIKMLWPYLRREPRLPVFDLRNGWSVLAMAAATGVNVLLLGIGVGFVAQRPADGTVWPLLVSAFLLGYLGLMLGRRKVAVRPRRWMVMACLLLLGVAIAACVNA